jgi:predicted nucleotidyltransferase component of viral defense system
VIEPPPLDVQYPTLLGGPSPDIRAYAQEAVIAEKLHAMIFLGTANSRMKDFYDVYLLSERFTFSGEVVSKAIAATFLARKTSVPSSLNELESFFSDKDKMNSWQAFLKRNDLFEAPEDFMIVKSRFQMFLNPLLASIANTEPFCSTWKAGGPWAKL